MKKLFTLLLLCGIGVGTSGCLVTAAGVTGAVLAGRTIYCTSVTDSGKEAIRDFATYGQQMVMCPGAD